jgi:hypothetical protein
VSKTYAVVWQVGDEPAQVGSLALGAGLLLQGKTAELRLASEDVLDVERTSVEHRLGRRPTLLLRRTVGAAVAISPLDGPGRAQELRDAVALLSLRSRSSPV